MTACYVGLPCWAVFPPREGGGRGEGVCIGGEGGGSPLDPGAAGKHEPVILQGLTGAHNTTVNIHCWRNNY